LFYLIALTAGRAEPILDLDEFSLDRGAAMHEDKNCWANDPAKAIAANDNVAKASGNRCILAIARLIGRRIAREEFERRVAAANDNAPVEKQDKD
jgi:hypothetical protein